MKHLKKMITLWPWAALAAAVLAVCWPMATLRLANPDAVWNSLEYKADWAWEISCGRPGTAFVAFLRGWAVHPFLAVAVSCLLAVAAGALCARAVGLSGRAALLGAGIVAVSAQSIEVMSYYFETDAYFLGQFLAVAAVVCAARGGWGRAALGGVLLAAGLSMYQAYLSSAMVLCLLVLLVRLPDAAPTQLARLTGRFALMGGAGVGVYLAGMKLGTAAGVFPQASREGFTAMGTLDPARLPGSIAQSYRVFADYYFGNGFLNNTRTLGGVFHALLFLLVGVLWVRALRGAQPWRWALCGAGFALLPAALCCWAILAPDVDLYGPTGLLMLPAMRLMVLLPLAGIAREKAAPLRIAALAMAGVAMAAGVAYCGLYQWCGVQNLNKTLAVATDLVQQAQGQTNTPVLYIAGRMEEGNYPASPEWAYDLVAGSPTFGFFWEDELGRASCWQNFLREYVHSGIPYAGEGERTAVLESGILDEMPVYPAPGSVRLWQGITVVKLS